MNEIKKMLLDKKHELESRLDRIAAHAGEPLDKDSEERAIQLENEEVLEGLSVEGKQELAQVNSALERLEKGTYGQCAKCREPIPLARLKAMPFAVTCMNCA